MNRRSFVQKSALGAFAASNLSFALLKPTRKAPLCYFTKELQWLSYEELGMVMNELGYNGVDLTLRKGGSIEPEDAAKELPKLVKALSQYNIQVPMMASNIADIRYTNLEEFLKIIADNGIRYYRMAYLKYDKRTSIDQNLERFHRIFEDLAALNAKYNIAASYQNHAGVDLGASIWDLFIVLKGIDKQQIGSQFDIRHAVVEGGQAWKLDFKAIQPFINTIVTKDFYWDKNEKGKWFVKNVPLGEGMVDFEEYFSMYHAAKLDVPMTNHTEYHILTDEEKKLSSTDKLKIILPFLRKDLSFIKKYL